MPRLSLYSPTKGNNYKYIDRVVKEQFQIGGTDLLVHKYLGPQNNGESSDLTQPQNTSPNPLAIQDLLFMENRNRVYEQDIYRLRGHYNVQNLDFDLSQFGLFLTNDVIFITVHYNDMIDLIGRKLMVGDVFELPHLTDYHPLNEAIPVSLRRYYQITDANYASEGFSQTWYPHLWRIKCEPLVDSQEFANILTAPVEKDNYMGNWDPLIAYPVGYTVQYGGKNYTPVKGPVPVGIEPTNTEWWRVDVASSLKDIISTYNKNLEVNDAILAEAARMVPNTGFDNSQLYLVPSTTSGTPDIPVDIVTNRSAGPALPIREGTGTVALFNSKRFKNSSVGIKVGRETAGKLASGNRVVFATGTLRADRSDTGSGRTFGSQVLTATIYTDSLKTGPYGTADNTYATSDLYLRFYITASQNRAKTTIIKLLEWNNDLDTGLLIKGSVLTANGTLISLFADGTRITAIDKTKKTITVSNELLEEIAAGQELEIAYDFYGIYQSVTTFATKQGAKRFKLMTYTSNLKEGTEIRSFVDVSGTRTRVFAEGTTVTKIETVSELVTGTGGGADYADWAGSTAYSEGDVVRRSIPGSRRAAVYYYRALNDIPSSTTGFYASDWTRLNTRPASATDVYEDFVYMETSTPSLVSVVDETVVEFDFGDGKVVDNRIDFRADADPRFQYIRRASPRNFGYLAGYGSGDGSAPNGEPAGSGIEFPVAPKVGDFFLRTDYAPQQLYRWDGQLWIKISEKVRVAPGFASEGTNQKSNFINNTGTVTLADGSTIPSRQGLSNALKQ